MVRDTIGDYQTLLIPHTSFAVVKSPGRKILHVVGLPILTRVGLYSVSGSTSYRGRVKSKCERDNSLKGTRQESVVTGVPWDVLRGGRRSFLDVWE